MFKMCYLGSAKYRPSSYSRNVASQPQLQLKNKCNCFLPFPWSNCSPFIQQSFHIYWLGDVALGFERGAEVGSPVAFRVTGEVKSSPDILPITTIWGHRNLLLKAQLYSVLPLNRISRKLHAWASRNSVSPLLKPSACDEGFRLQLKRPLAFLGLPRSPACPEHRICLPLICDLQPEGNLTVSGDIFSLSGKEEYTTAI